MSENKETLLDKLLANVEKVVSEVKKPLIKNKVARTFGAAIDDALSQKDDAEEQLANLRKRYIEDGRLEDTINKVVALRFTIENADKTIEILEAERALVLGK